MHPIDIIARCPADIPSNAQLFQFSVGCERTLRTCQAVRPDIRVLSEAKHLTAEDWVVVSGPTFLADIERARKSGVPSRSIVLPAIGGSYHRLF